MVTAKDLSSNRLTVVAHQYVDWHLSTRLNPRTDTKNTRYVLYRVMCAVSSSSSWF